MIRSVNIVIVVGPMAATTAFVRTDESEAGGLGHFDFVPPCAPRH